MVTDNYHIPVLLNETIDGLNIRSNNKYIDTTIGGGGHTGEILKRGGTVLGIDQDDDALEFVKQNLKSQISNFKLKVARGNFKDLKKIANQNGFNKVSGVLFDLGVSSHQLETAERGFSFNKDAVLDMRMDKELTVSAKELINGLNEGELYELFNKYAETNNSRAIARAIIRARTIKPIVSTNELAEILVKAQGKKEKIGRTHPATRIFQALRIAVNDELNNLKEALPQAVELLDKKGRIAVLSFHSLEDRIIKNFFKEMASDKTLQILNVKPITPTEGEIAINPRSRSAKLRIAIKN
ncbi:MAG: 16S rRNA (cytosine(1402)-N(4))-methyltransferase RsmH [Candidatus Gottesmanbacteria bacterium]